MRRGPANRNPDRLPPHSVEAEAGVLGCCLLSPEQCLDGCEERGLVPAAFYDVRHQLIYQALSGMHQAGAGIDIITLVERLRSGGALEQAGGLEYLGTLPDATPTSANLEYYLEIVAEKAVLRKLLALTTGAVSRIQEYDGRASDLVESIEGEILRLGEARTSNERALSGLVEEALQELEEYHRGRAQIRGLTSGLDSVDKFLCGIGKKNGNYVVLSGRPGTGKTTLAIQMAVHAALDYEHFAPVTGDAINGDGSANEPKFEKRKGIPVGIFSLEMASAAVVHRLLFQRSGQDLQRWRTGFAESDAVPALVKAGTELRAEHVWIDDTPRCTIEQLRAKARRWRRQHGIELFVLDYIQLVRSQGNRFRNDRVQELAEISGEIQALGKELDVPWVVLAQMNRDFEKEGKGTRAPRLTDLKDCGSIEQDADVVGFLYTPVMAEKEQKRYDALMDQEYPKNEEGKRDWTKVPWRENLMLAKNRYGPTGTCKLLFQKSCTRFLDWEEWAKQHERMI